MDIDLKCEREVKYVKYLEKRYGDKRVKKFLKKNS